MKRKKEKEETGSKKGEKKELKEEIRQWTVSS
jgi:hypothetical protein